MKHTKVERFLEARIEIRTDDELPPGVCGRITAVALTFDTPDTFGTMFAPGCAARSIGQRVAARRVPFLMDHERTVRTHVGVVAMMEEVGSSYATSVDLFDTEDGRRALDYAKAVRSAGASTGVSIGFIPMKSEMVKGADGRTYERFTEIALRELSLTPMPSVPGADVIGARADSEAEEPLARVRDDATLLGVAARAALDAMSPEARTELLKQYAAPSGPPASASSASAETRTAPPPDPRAMIVPMAERMKLARATFGPAPTQS